MNEFYKMPPMPECVEEGILKGIYRFSKSQIKDTKLKAHLFGSGTILNEAIKAQKELEEKYNVSVDVWSVTSYKELYMDAISAERVNTLNPETKPVIPYISKVLEKETGVFIAASDYIKALPATITKWIPGEFYFLGTDGFGRSDGREQLRDFFEVDYRYITVAALNTLAKENKIKPCEVEKAVQDLGLNSKKPNPIKV